MADVSLKNVAKVYPGGIRAIQNLTLTAAEGEFVVVVGPSGCGKSTTLRVVAGLENVSAGTIRIGGRLVNDVSPKDRDVAFVFQDQALYPHLKVSENLGFGLKVRRVGRAEVQKRVAWAAEWLDIEDLLDRWPGTLSGGQRQRVALGRAIVRRPSVFLMDEPLSDLDAGCRAQMRARLKALHRQLNTTIIYVTHDQQEAMTLADRVAVMNSGEVPQFGPPLEVYNRPVNRFVAGFLGDPPMNFIQGRLVDGADGLCFKVSASPARAGGGMDGAGSANGLRLPDRFRLCLQSLVDRPVVLGIRPEGLSPVPENERAEPGCFLAVRVCSVELLGDKVNVYGQTAGGDRVVFPADARRVLKEGLVLALHVNMQQVHVFESGGEGVNVSLAEVGVNTSAD